VSTITREIFGMTARDLLSDPSLCPAIRVAESYVSFPPANQLSLPSLSFFFFLLNIMKIFSVGEKGHLWEHFEIPSCPIARDPSGERGKNYSQVAKGCLEFNSRSRKKLNCLTKWDRNGLEDQLRNTQLQHGPPDTGGRLPSVLQPVMLPAMGGLQVKRAPHETSVSLKVKAFFCGPRTFTKL
jgi:hypothetical protein